MKVADLIFVDLKFVEMILFFFRQYFLSEIIVVKMKTNEMNNAEMISSEMIVCRNELVRVDTAFIICRVDFAELKRSRNSLIFSSQKSTNAY
jgi:hypothetical protein